MPSYFRSLLRPAMRDLAEQASQSHLRCLTPIQNFLDDVGCKECERKKSADIAFVKAVCFCDRSLIFVFSGDNLLNPILRPTDRFDQ